MKYWKVKLAVLSLVCATSFVKVYAFEAGLWPGEGRPSFFAKTDLKLYEKPISDSPIAKGSKILKGQKINFSETRFRTTTPGLVNVVAPSSITVRSYGAIDFLSVDDYYSKGTDKSIVFNSGESFEFLQYRGEGEWLMRINGEVMAFIPDQNIEFSSWSVTEWWVQVVNKEKKPIGWLLIEENTVEVTDREF